MAVLRVEAQLVLLGDAYNATHAEAVLRTLEEDSLLAPQRWGAEAGLRDAYSRRDIVQALVSNPDDLAPQLYRTTLPGKYRLRWYGGPTLSTLVFETAGRVDEAEAGAFFGAISELAGRLPLAVEWGHITTEFDSAPPGTNMQETSNFTHLAYYEQYGPSCVFPRTFFGRRLVGLMEGGAARYASLGFPWRPLADGGVEFDLMPEPWKGDPMELKAAQMRAHAQLFPTGIFCDESEETDPCPGPRWQQPVAQRRGEGVDFPG
jgi:hypothetical protein